MSNTLSIVAVIYGVMWLLSFWIQDIIYSTIVGGIGVVLVVVVAISIDGLFGDVDKHLTSKVTLELKIEKLQKEIDELKNSGKSQDKN